MLDGEQSEKAEGLFQRLIPKYLAKTVSSMNPTRKAHFFRKWLEHSTFDEANVVQHEQTMTSRSIRLVFKVWFFGVMLSFIGLFILPEFAKMAEEFGLERAGEFPMLFSLVIVFGYLSAILTLLLVVLFFLFLFFRNNRFLAAYLGRWNPWNWRRVTPSKRTQKRLSLAWKIHAAAFDRSSTDRGIDWAQETENGALSTSQANALSRIGDRETQAWLVANVAQSSRFVTKDRREWLFQLLVTAVHIILVVAVFIAAWTVLNFLLTIMTTEVGR